MTLCECGCGETVKPGNRFINGHQNKHRSPESIRKQVETAKRFSHIRKINNKLIKERRKELIKRNKGKTINEKQRNEKQSRQISKETRKKMSLAQTGRIITKQHRKRISRATKGRTFSEETKKRMSEAAKGKIVTEETKRRTSESLKGKMIGPKNPAWKGGISYGSYCYKFGWELRERVRNRDNRLCQNCGGKETGYRHAVHHVHYDKKNCYPDLITLCGSCNVKANTSRNFWEEYYMNKLNDRGLLFWTRRNSI